MKKMGKVCLYLVALCLLMPVNTYAAGKVNVKYRGVTKAYAGKITTAYINSKKKKLTSTPIFKKNGTYVGPVSELLVNSAFKVKCKNKGNKITLTYKKKKVILKDGSRNLVINKTTQKKVLGTAAMKNVRYSASKVSRWIVPLRSVCSRLGISYSVKNGTVYLGKTKAASSVTSNTKSNATAASISNNANQAAVKKKQIVLVLDAGHGGIDSGASGYSYREKNLTLAIILAAKQCFDKNPNFKVYYTRTSDTYPSLSDRSSLANNKNADLFISVHINSASSSATGTETLYNNSRLTATKKNNITSKQLAQAMQNAALDSTGFKNRGLVNRTGLWVLNKTKMPACLIEYGFISNRTEEKKMYANTSKYGKDLYNAIVAFTKNKGL